MGRPGIAIPYSAEEEQAFRLAADLRCRPGQAAEIAVVCLSLGAGMNGAEVKLATPDDVVAVGEGRVAVRVKGRHPRLAPIRKAYTDLIRKAVAAAEGGSFFEAVHVNAVHDAAQRVAAPDGGHLRLRRARVTWLRAHLVAGTDLAVLRVIAGPVSANTLSDLIAMSAAPLDGEAAAVAALRA